MLSEDVILETCGFLSLGLGKMCRPVYLPWGRGFLMAQIPSGVSTPSACGRMGLGLSTMCHLNKRLIGEVPPDGRSKRPLWAERASGRHSIRRFDDGTSKWTQWLLYREGRATRWVLYREGRTKQSQLRLRYEKASRWGICYLYYPRQRCRTELVAPAKKAVVPIGSR